MQKTSYHHGSLDSALTTVALKVVRKSGVNAISIRDIAREVGVAASAVYRHFPSRDDLLVRVSQLARERLAKDLTAACAEVPASGGAKTRAQARFKAIGKAYVNFALKQPRMFEAAFVLTDGRPETEDDPSAWSILVAVVNEMVDAGLVPASRRDEAPLIAWSGVHGLAKILTETAWPDGVEFDGAVDVVVEGIFRGIT